MEARARSVSAAKPLAQSRTLNYDIDTTQYLPALGKDNVGM